MMIINQELCYKKDIEFHYCIEAELAVPENKINEIFAYYDKHKKITVEEWMKTILELKCIQNWCKQR